MAFTKLYLTANTAPYTPATIRGAWDDSAGAVTRALEPSANVGGIITSVTRSETNVSGTWDVLLYRGISGSLAAQTISGTINVMIGVDVDNAAADFCWHVHVYVTQGDSDTPRGTLLVDYTEAVANEWPATDAGKALVSAQSLSSLAISAGDRLVVELGYIARNVSTTSRTGEIWYGTINPLIETAGSDLTVGVDPSNKAGFLTFSSTITESSTGVSERISQYSVETLLVATSVPFAVTQYSVEILSANVAAITSAETTQFFIIS